MKTDRLSNFLGLCLIIALLLSVGAFFLVKPSIHRSDNSKEQIKKANADIEGLHQLQTETEKLRENYVAVKDKRDQILHELPTKSEEERLLALVSSLGQQSGVVVSSFVPSGAAADPTSSIATYPVAVSVTGSYAQIQAFLKLVENSARFIDVQSASISGAAGVVSTSLTVQAYYQSEASQTMVGGTK